MGNTQSSWQGCYAQTSGSFWGGTAGGPCPGVNEWGQVIFSYGHTTLSQTASVAAALEAAGTGLLITGYNYGWSVKNSNINGAQPGQYDPTAYVTVTLLNRDGTVAHSDVYDYGYWMPQWVRFSGTRTYDTPYSLATVDNITLSVTGRDHGFWAGYYGAEFGGFNLTVNYSIDPCVADPLWSPTCSGYAQALLAQLAPDTSTTDIITEPTDAVTDSPADSPPVAMTQSPESQATSTDATAPQAMAAVSATPTSSSGSARVGASLGTILGILQSEQARVASVERSTVEQAAESGQASISAVEAAALDTAQQSSAQSLEQMATQFTLEQDRADIATPAAPDTARAVLGSGITPGVAPEQTLEIVLPEVALPQVFSLVDPTASGQDNISATDIAEDTTPAGGQNPPQIPLTDTVLDNDITPGSGNIAVTGAEAVDTMASSQRPANTVEATPDTARAREPATSQDLGAQDFVAFATAPQGFDAYRTAMPDGAFYASREIYPRQAVTDNPRGRALFGGSDRRHQEMTEQQYRR